MKVPFLHPAKPFKLKEILHQYAAYNIWANQRIADLIVAQPSQVVQQVVVSSFASVVETFYHLWYAESIWWQRIKLAENVQPPQADRAKVTELVEGLLKQSKLWEEWVQKSTEAAFLHEFVYRNSKKEQFKQPVYQVLMHLFNHQTYHRGQIITLLRQLGVDKLPLTDFIEFTRRKK